MKLSVKFAGSFHNHEKGEAEQTAGSVFRKFTGENPGKTGDFRGKWNDLTPGEKGIIEKVAGGLVRKHGREKWKETMEEMGLAAPPLVEITKNTAVIVFPGEEKESEVRSVMFWNVNGLRARWAARTLGFREVVEAKTPDVCAVLEVRSDWQSLVKTQDFEGWLREKGFRYCYFMWTGEDRTSIGKAGVALLCRKKPKRVWFGVGEEGKDLVGRVVRAEYEGFFVVATYHPQGGFT